MIANERLAYEESFSAEHAYHSATFHHCVQSQRRQRLNAFDFSQHYMAWLAYVSKHSLALHLCLIHFKIQSPMPFTARIECPSAFCTNRSTLHVFFNGKYMFALPTKNCLLVPLEFRPYFWLMSFQCIVAAYARVKFIATSVFNGDDVNSGEVVGALRQWGNGLTVYYRWWVIRRG